MSRIIKTIGSLKQNKMPNIKEFSWEEHIKDPSKTYYRCGKKPSKVWEESGFVFSLLSNTCKKVHTKKVFVRVLGDGITT